jgi:hypothetical protein
MQNDRTISNNKQEIAVSDNEKVTRMLKMLHFQDREM